MKPKRTLVLRSEALGDLSADELAGVVGAASGPSCEPDCPTLEVACPSNPVTNCTVIQVTRYATCIC